MAKILKTRDAVLTLSLIQHALDEHDYALANTLREEMIGKLLNSVQSDNVSRVELKDVASMVAQVDDLYPIR